MTTLAVTAARTLGDMKARIADEIARSDLTSQIANAIDDAIDIASANRFWFNEVRGLPLTLQASQGGYYIDSDIDALVEIDAVYLLINSTQRWNLRPISSARMDALSSGTPSTGQPTVWARYGSELKFWPIPQQSYSVKIDGLTRGDPMEGDDDSNGWTTYGEKYVRALAKTLLYAEVIRDTAETQKQEQLAEQYKNNLLNHTESRAMTGEMEPFGV